MSSARTSEVVAITMPAPMPVSRSSSELSQWLTTEALANARKNTMAMMIATEKINHTRKVDMGTRTHQQGYESVGVKIFSSVQII